MPSAAVEGAAAGGSGGRPRPQERRGTNRSVAVGGLGDGADGVESGSCGCTCPGNAWRRRRSLHEAAGMAKSSGVATTNAVVVVSLGDDG